LLFVCARLTADAARLSLRRKKRERRVQTEWANSIRRGPDESRELLHWHRATTKERENKQRKTIQIFVTSSLISFRRWVPPNSKLSGWQNNGKWRCSPIRCRILRMGVNHTKKQVTTMIAHYIIVICTVALILLQIASPIGWNYIIDARLLWFDTWRNICNKPRKHLLPTI
jgi:hypothetical protein